MHCSARFAIYDLTLALANTCIAQFVRCPEIVLAAADIFHEPAFLDVDLGHGLSTSRVHAGENRRSFQAKIGNMEKAIAL